MVETLILSAIARTADRVVISALHSQMQGYNARLAPKADRNAQLVAAFAGTVTKCPPAKRTRRAR